MRNATVRSVLYFACMILCGVAMWISLQLIGIHLSAGEAHDDGWLASICESDADESISCEKVVKSDYGTVGVPWWFDQIQEVKKADGTVVQSTRHRLGRIRVPVAQFGLCYYIFMLVWLLSTGIPQRAMRGWHLLPLVLSILAVCTSLWFIYVLAAKLDVFCRLCAGLHGINFILCGSMALLWPRAPRAAPEDWQVDRPLRRGHALVTLGCIAAACAFTFAQEYAILVTRQAVSANEKLQNARKTLVDSFRAKHVTLARAGYSGVVPTTIPLRPDPPVMGDPDARHEIVIFSDLQCPACRTFEAMFKKEILPLWNGHAKLIYRHYPLSSACNPGLQHDLKHDHACEAAYAAEAAKIQGGSEAFWQMHDLIQRNHAAMHGPDFGREEFEAMANSIGLDLQRFREDFDSQAVRDIVQQDVQVSRSLKNTGTPSIYVDGRKLLSYQLQATHLEFWQWLAETMIKQDEHTTATSQRTP